MKKKQQDISVLTFTNICMIDEIALYISSNKTFVDTLYWLICDLLHHFQKKIVSISDLDEYVLSTTMFCRSRYKEHLLKPLEQEGRIRVLSTNSLRQFGEYTERERVHFHQAY